MIKQCFSEPQSMAKKNIVRMLLTRKNADIDGRNMVGRTPSSLASENGHLEVMKILLQAGEIDIDPRDWDGRTSLSFAAGEGEEDTVSFLLSLDPVSPDFKDNGGHTPLFYLSYNTLSLTAIKV